MRIGALSLFVPTSCRRTFSVASWHSVHSLTWRWAISVARQPLMIPRPYAFTNSVGFGVGLGQLLGFSAYRTNGGWQPTVSVLWHSIDVRQQKPMWFCDLWRRKSDRRDRLSPA